MYNYRSGNYEIGAYNETAISILENALKFNNLEYTTYNSYIVDLTTREKETGINFVIKPRDRKEKKLIENISKAMNDLFIDGIAL